MNTADRSIALLDTALRRRFGFIELMPDISVLEGAVVEGIPLGQWLRELNQRICAHVGRDARNLQIGHAYLLHEGRPVTRFIRFARIVRDDLIPLLQEYCYADISQIPATKRSSYSNGLFESIENGPVTMNHACWLAPWGQSCPRRLGNNDPVPLQRSIIL